MKNRDHFKPMYIYVASKHLFNFIANLRLTNYIHILKHLENHWLRYLEYIRPLSVLSLIWYYYARLYCYIYCNMVMSKAWFSEINANGEPYHIEYHSIYGEWSKRIWWSVNQNCFNNFSSCKDHYDSFIFTYCGFWVFTGFKIFAFIHDYYFQQ